MNNNDEFEAALSIKRVGLTKLTQALFLINPERFLPIDNRIMWLPVLNINLDQVKEQIIEAGAGKYKEILGAYKKAFPGCLNYEINLLCGLLAVFRSNRFLLVGRTRLFLGC